MILHSDLEHITRIIQVEPVPGLHSHRLHRREASAVRHVRTIRRTQVDEKQSAILKKQFTVSPADPMRSLRSLRECRLTGRISSDRNSRARDPESSAPESAVKSNDSDLSRRRSLYILLCRRPLRRSLLRSQINCLV